MNIGIDDGDGDYSAVTFAKMDGDVAVIMDTLQGEPADVFIALLRVARAAKTIVDTPDKQFFSLDDLEEAIKEVDDLL